MLKTILLTTILGLALGTSSAFANDAKKPAKDKPATEETAEVKAYPLNTCIISDEEFDPEDEPVVTIHEGQEIKTCCKKCMRKFKENPDKYMKQLEEAVAKLEKEKESKE